MSIYLVVVVLMFIAEALEHDKWNWLHYNVESDSAYCYICMKASKERKLLTSKQ